MRATLDREAVVRARFDDEFGSLVDADAPPSVVVLDGAGTQLYTGTATHATTGLYEYVLPAQTQVDHLTVRFTGAVGGLSRVVKANVNVVGGRLVPLWRLRVDAELGGMDSMNFQRIADAMEDWFERALKYPITLTSRRVTWQFTGGSRMRIPNTPFPKALYALSTNGTIYSPADLALITTSSYGFEYATIQDNDPIYGFQTGSVGTFKFGGLTTAWVGHGPSPDWEGYVPEDLRRAGVVMARYLSRGAGNYPERATQVATEGAVISFAVPSPDRPTGLPEVDGVINGYRLSYPV